MELDTNLEPSSHAASQERRQAAAPKLLVPRLRAFYDRMEPVAYVLLRASFGLIMVTHGLPKLTGTAHGSMADPLAASTNLIANVLHLPFAPQLAWFVALLEGVGGLMLALGLFTRLVAPMMVVQMAAICYILGPKLPWIDRGMEFPLLMAFVAFYLSIRGGGRGSLDWRIGREL